MPAEPPPPVVPPVLLGILNTVLSELRSVADRHPEDPRLQFAVSNIEAAARSLGSPVLGSPVLGSPVPGSPVLGSPVLGSPSEARR
jgi:hypothetical protein